MSLTADSKLWPDITLSKISACIVSISSSSKEDSILFLSLKCRSIALIVSSYIFTYWALNTSSVIIWGNLLIICLTKGPNLLIKSSIIGFRTESLLFIVSKPILSIVGLRDKIVSISSSDVTRLERILFSGALLPPVG